VKISGIREIQFFRYLVCAHSLVYLQIRKWIEMHKYLAVTKITKADREIANVRRWVSRMCWQTKISFCTVDAWDAPVSFAKVSRPSSVINCSVRITSATPVINPLNKGYNQLHPQKLKERRNTGEPMISTYPRRKSPASRVIRPAKKVIKEAICEAVLPDGSSARWCRFLRMASPTMRLRAASGRTASLLVGPRIA